MSLFIGKDNSGKEIMHITDGNHSVEYMKSGIKPETTFHNDLEFDTYQIHPVTTKVWKKNRAYYHCVSCSSYSGDPYAPKYQQAVGLGVVDTPNHRIYWLDKNKNILPDSMFVFGSRYLKNVSTCYNRSSRGPSYYIPYFKVSDKNCANNSSPSKRDVMPIRYSVNLFKNKIMYSSGVSIKGTYEGTPATFIVGGLDLANIRYVANKRLNNHPSCIMLGHQQLIDASKIPGGVEITSNPLDGTQIKKGGYVIIDGSVATVKLQTHSFSVTGRGTVNRFAVTAGTIHKIISPSGTIYFTVTEGKEEQIYYYTYQVYNGIWFSHDAYTIIYYGVRNGMVYTRTTNAEAGHISYTVEVYQ